LSAHRAEVDPVGGGEVRWQFGNDRQGLGQDFTAVMADSNWSRLPPPCA